MREWLRNLLKRMLRALDGRSNTSASASDRSEDARVRQAPLPARRQIARPPRRRPNAPALEAPRRHGEQTQMGHTIALACAAGDRAVQHFEPLLDDYDEIDPQTAIVAEITDFSGSTRGAVGNALAPALTDGRRLVLEAGGQGLMWQLGFSESVFALDEQNPLRSLADARPITAADFAPGGFGGGGTNASMAIVVGVSLLVAHRKRGHTGELKLCLWTDGCDTQPRGSDNRRRCRQALRLARKNGIAVEARGFCPAGSWGSYLEWKAEVDLKDEEAFVVKLEADADVGEVVRGTVVGHTQSICDSMTSFSVPRPRRLDAGDASA